MSGRAEGTSTVLLPNSVDQSIRADMPIVFLAGSIDEGRAEKWQDEAIAVLSSFPMTILNPRRDDWNPDLRQSEDEPEFVAQVEWELDGIEAADVVLFHFSPAGPAPITLLELGKATGMGKRIVVSCPQGYWRRGNVQVVCRRAGVRVHGSLHDAIADLLTILPDVAAAKDAKR